MEKSNIASLKAEIAYLEAELQYDDKTLLFLVSKLTEDERVILRDIANSSDPIGYRKLQAPDYTKKRRMYDNAWSKLEGQGFISVNPAGNMRICKVTIRGEQALNLLNRMKE